MQAIATPIPDQAVWPAPRLLAAVALTVVGIVVNFDVWADIFTFALKDEEAQQVFLVLPVFAWLAWSRRGALAVSGVKPSFSLAGPAMIALAWVFSYVGFNYAVQAMWHASAVLIAVGCLVTVLGHRFVLALWPAFVVLVFLVPVPAMFRLQIAVPLQSAVAMSTHFLGDLIGMDIQRSGNWMSYNGAAVTIAEGCNGMRMMFMLILVSFAFAFVVPLQGWARVLVIVISPLTALVSNVIRLVPTVYIFGHSNQQTAESFHDFAGWVMVFVSLGLLICLIKLMDWVGLPVMAEPERRASGAHQ